MSSILIWETLANIGGGQEMTLKVADILKENHSLHFLIPEKGELSQQLDKRNIPYTLMGDQTMPKGTKGIKGLIKFLYLTVLASIKGRKEVRKINPDYLYAPGPAALVWSAMCAKRSTKVVWHLHHFFPSGATRRLLNIFSSAKCVKRIISVSDYVGEQINNPKAQSKKLTLYNPVSSLSQDVPRKNLCDEFEKLDKKLRVAQIGFITPTKGQMLSVEVMHNLKSRGYDAALAIIGSVSEGDDAFKVQLDEKIKEYGLLDNIVFTGYRTDVSEILSTFDVLFVPCAVEGFSLAAAQAITENVPVLCVDKTGCAEIVTKSNCGMVFTVESDVSVVADTLIKTAQIDVKAVKEKHPDFLLSECSVKNFSDKINESFTI